MRNPFLLLYQSPELASNSNVYIDYTREASAHGAKLICHYHAVPDAFKGIEPRIALPYSSISLSSQSEEPVKSLEITVETSQSGSILDQSSTDRTWDPSPPSKLEELIQDARLRVLSPPPAMEDDRLEESIQDARPGVPSGPRRMEDDIPIGDAEDINSWGDDDVDGTDFKNTPDYDPWQEESIYESTPEPDATAQSLEDLSFEDKPCIRRYVMLHSTQAPAPKHLLLLFIPGPLNVLAPSLPPFEPTTPSKHTNFLAHFSRYPYLTIHKNYIRHTGYVLDSADDTPAHYLIVQEFSELRNLDWELKRKEAKHWWRKEERGASGVRVGFFALAGMEDIG